MGGGSIKVLTRPPAPQPNAVIGPEITTTSVKRLPVFGSAQAGPGGAFSWTNAPVDDVACPPALLSVPEAYAVYVVGDSMEPRYFAGETVYVHPSKPARRGDFVVLQVRTASDAVVGYIKRLVRTSEVSITVEQLNPEKQMTFELADVVAVHRIVSSSTD
ncbi:S24 family peptidase [Enterovirga sp. CN4-39]|uniref:S24 family peptidase n=1 Tax=Enterovirga sp. CN4-39 TaxID=3400910 RepID=UPI003C099CC4